VCEVGFGYGWGHLAEGRILFDVHDAYPLGKASHSSPSPTKARSPSKKGHLPYEKVYGIVLLMAAIAYHLLQQAIIRTQREGSILKDAIRRDWKGKLSPVLYLFAVVATLRSSWIAQAVLVIAALIWLIPDQRIEKRLAVSGRLASGPR
jgi:hypothetical protein